MGLPVAKRNSMLEERKNSLTLLVLLCALVFVYHFASGIYYARGLGPSPTIEFLYPAAFVCGVVWWLQEEASRSGIKPVYCRGLLVSVGWLFMIPYYLLKARGVRGLIPLSALVGSFLLAYVLVVIVLLFSQQMVQ
jgi:hypothetical protein